MTTIIAEIGVNWDGNFNLVKEIMSRVKEAGCDAVKFQAFDEKIVQSQAGTLLHHLEDDDEETEEDDLMEARDIESDLGGVERY